MTDASAGLGRRARWHRTVEDVNMDLAALDLDKAREFFALRYFGAVESLTRALAVELAPIRVNAVSPGVVRSPLRAWLTLGGGTALA